MNNWEYKPITETVKLIVDKINDASKAPKPTDKHTTDELVKSIGGKTGPDNIRYITRRMHYMYEIFNRGAFAPEAVAMALFFTHYPVFVGDSTKLGKAIAIGDFYSGLRTMNTLYKGTDHKIVLLNNDDALYSLVGVHYFFLKNQALMEERNGGIPPVGDRTYDALEAAVTALFKGTRSQNMYTNAQQLYDILKQSKSKEFSLSFQLLKTFLATNYTNTRATVLIYDSLIADIFTPVLTLA